MSEPVPESGASEAELALVKAAAGGDQDAFRTLWTQAQRPAWALCVRLTGNPTDAADALQDAQLAAWRNLHRFQGRCPFGAWVYAIARNAALAVVRARAKRAEVDLDDSLDRPDGGPTPFTDGVIESMVVRDALQTLPDKHREALLLWVGGLAYEQVAGLMDAPVNSVRVWIHRARTALRGKLAQT